MSRALGTTAGARTFAGLSTAARVDEADLETLRREWDALVDNSRQRVYFLRWSWTVRWWRTYAPPGSRLFVITCRDRHGRLVGLAPLYWRQHRTAGVPHARELRFLGTGIGIRTSEYLDLVAREDGEAQVADAVAAFLHATDAWDHLSLEGIPASSAMLPPFARALGPAAWYSPCDRSHYIDTSTDWTTFLGTLTDTMRRHVGSYTRRLFQLHACAFERVTTPQGLESAMDALVRLHQARWISKGHPGSFSLSRFESFLRGAATASLGEGRLRLWTLRVDGHTAAALLGFFDAGRVHYFQSGFDPEYKKYSLGNVLLGLCMRDCVEAPDVSEFDFMGGDADHKKHWTRLHRDSVWLRFQRPGIRSLAYATSQRTTEAAASLARSVLPRPLRRMCQRAMRRWQGIGPVAAKR